MIAKSVSILSASSFRPNEIVDVDRVVEYRAASLVAVRLVVSNRPPSVSDVSQGHADLSEAICTNSINVVYNATFRFEKAAEGHADLSEAICTNSINVVYNATFRTSGEVGLLALLRVD